MASVPFFLQLPGALHQSSTPLPGRAYPALGGHPPPVASWAISRFRVCAGGQATFRDLWNHVATAQSGHIDAKAEVPDIVDPCMRQVKKNWCVERRLAPPAELEDCKMLVAKTLSAEFGSADRSVAFLQTSLSPTRALWHRWCSHADTQASYKEYTKDFQIYPGTTIAR